MSDALAADRQAIREVIENWVLWRDAGDWERFATVWHDDGWMTATWFQGPARDFIRVSREGFERGVNILHFLGGFTCDIAGDRAISQVKMTINQRAEVDGVLVDVVCTGRFYDFLEKRQGRWGIVRRQPIYEKDRMDPVDPAARLTLDRVAAGVVSRGLPPPRLPAVEGRLHREDRPPRPARSGGRERSTPKARPGLPARRRPAFPSEFPHADEKARSLRRVRPRLRVHEPVARLRHAARARRRRHGAARGARRRLHARRLRGALRVRRQRDADRQRAQPDGAGSSCWPASAACSATRRGSARSTAGPR